MNRNNIRSRVALTITIIVATIAFFGIPRLTSNADTESTSRAGLWRAASWRVDLFARKAVGKVAELSWIELLRMARVRGGFGLEAAARGGQGLEGSVNNPYISESDLRAGAIIYRERCSACHGGEGSGLLGPALNRPGLVHGASDFAIYRIVRDGVPNASMRPVDLDFVERWQVVGHVRRLQAQASQAVPADLAPPRIFVASERIRSAGSRTDEWLTYSGSLDGQRYSALAEVNASNVSQLRLLWSRQLDTSGSKFEATPIVVDGVIFITAPPAIVVALDAKTGAVRWTFNRALPADLPLCCGLPNRGLAILDDKLFFGSLDGYLIAISADTGRMLWQTKVASSADGYSLTGAPLVVGRHIVTGVAGGEYPTRGFLAAYDTTSGRQVWRFNTIPGPGEFGHETWKNEAWKTGGGATWVTGSYDPSLGIVYWGVGNPNPEFNGDVRPGDNLFTNSVIALHADTGKLAWHFQFTPHDEHDWDSTQTPILAELPINGVVRKVICWANRNGFYYVLDRSTGEYLVGKAFAELTWARGLDSRGRPIQAEGQGATKEGRFTRPGVAGATNWQNAAFDRDRGLVFVPATESMGGVFTKSPDPKRVDNGMRLGSSGSTLAPIKPVVRAIDASSGTVRWERFAPEATEFAASHSGLLATQGGLIFGAARGHVFALESSSGKDLWSIYVGGQTVAAPITYTVDGKQVISLLAGRTLFTFGL